MGPVTLPDGIHDLTDSDWDALWILRDWPHDDPPPEATARVLAMTYQQRCAYLDATRALWTELTKWEYQTLCYTVQLDRAKARDCLGHTLDHEPASQIDKLVTPGGDATPLGRVVLRNRKEDDDRRQAPSIHR
jgi:hypothetical protein